MEDFLDNSCSDSGLTCICIYIAAEFFFFFQNNGIAVYGVLQTTHI